MLAMDPPGSSQWMDLLEPELEAATLNFRAGRAGPGSGLIQEAAPCPVGTRPCRQRGGMALIRSHLGWGDDTDAVDRGDVGSPLAAAAAPEA